jgi:hypothetical protein
MSPNDWCAILRGDLRRKRPPIYGLCATRIALRPSLWCVIYDLYGLRRNGSTFTRLVESSDPSMDVNPLIDQELSRPEPPGAIKSGELL